MARGQDGGGGGYAVAIVLFGIGFFICLIWAILITTKVGAANQAAQDAERQLNQFATAAQRRSEEVQAYASGGGSIVQNMLEELRTLKGTIAGDQQIAMEAVTAQLEADGISGSLFGEISRMRAENQSLRQQVERATQDLNESNETLAANEQEKTQIKQAFDDATKELTQQVQGARDKYETLLANVAEIESSATSQMQQIRAESEARIAELETQLAGQRREIVLLEQKIKQREATDPLAGSDITAIDGRLVSIVQDRNQVYIDLGRADRVRRGMTFEVFDANTLVKIDELEAEVRGKATIEIVNVDEQSSVARVVRQDRGTTLKEGDGIINLAFDPNSSPRFFVYGKFDINNTGDATVADRARIESIIQKWGGEVAREIDFSVDFLVLGVEPPIPDPIDEDEIDPEKIARQIAAQEDYKRYQNLKGEARDQKIPILSQNRFLWLVGYYDR